MHDTTVDSERTMPGASGVRSRQYLALALLAAVMVAIGFWPSYFGVFLTGTPDVSALIHVHAAVYVGWLVLFIVQVALAATGRIALHMRLGNWLMAYGLLLVVAGLMASWDGFGIRFESDGARRAEQWVFGALRDLVFFVPFLVAGWLYRRRPEVHKRLMIVATTVLLVPAIGRMGFLGRPPPLWAFMAVWPLPVYVAMLHDFRTRRLVHPVYVIGVAAMLAHRVVLPLRDTDAWHALAAQISALYSALR